jgi:hypothetical protein
MKALAALLILTGLQLAACAQDAGHKAWLDDRDRRHAVVVETMSGTGGK